jgi:8-oxo-dGTP pyrophosphatase MutT (NUDIX family)
MKRLRASRAKPVVLDPIWPNVGVQAWYQAQLDALINSSFGQLTHELAAAWNKTPPLFHNVHLAEDAKPPFAAGVCVTSHGRVLLMFRNDGEGWAFPGGMIEPNESPEDAARRELFEETLHVHNGPFDAAEVRDGFVTYTTNVLEPFVPTLNSEHAAFAWVTVPQALGLSLHPGVRKTLKDCSGAGLLTRFTDANGVEYLYAEDAAPPSGTKALQAALQRWGSQTIERFDKMSAKIADDFAKRNQFATQTAMMGQLKKAGFTVAFKPTQKSIEAFRAIVAENVSLIRSIPTKAHAQVEQKVWNAVRQGSDLHKLSQDLAKTHKITTDRAALIARDQNAKGKATIERVRQMELGITKAIWMHSHAGKEPRPTHVAMNEKQYNLAQGMWDSDENEWVHPGQLINCRCSNRPIIEGFE